LFLNYYYPFTPSYRGRAGVTSFLSSKKIKKDLKIQIFKKKVYNNHKFLSNTNSVMKLNMLKPYTGLHILIKIFKTSYSNSIFGFFEHYDGSISCKKLGYGVSFNNILFENNYLDFRVINKISSGILQKLHVCFFDVNFKFFLFRCNVTNKLFASSAGTFCTIRNKELSKYTFFIRLPSKKCFFFNMLSTAFVGRVSNIYYRFTRFSSFSHRFSIKKKYQTTRGVAKNPVDHPNGGRSKIKQPFLNPWGRVAKNNK
jgi:hypothetical protein